jgi:hypothetical protein
MSIFLGVLLLFVGVVGWRNHLQKLEIQGLKKQLKVATAQECRARGIKRKALLSVTALAELQGWKEASPFASDFVGGLTSFSSALLLQDCLLERQFSIKPLDGGSPSPGLPSPVHTLCLFDSALLTVYETKKGSGVRPLPALLSQIKAATGCPVEYERCSWDARWDEPGTDRVAGKSAWNLSVEIPPHPLWGNIWGQP